MKNSITLFDLQKKISRQLKENSLSDEFVGLIQEKPPLSIKDRFEIYRYGYRLRMVQAIREDFPLLEEKIGENGLQDLIWDFVRLHPSTYASLSEVSQGFPLFLRSFSEEFYELASRDWIEILSYQCQKICSSNLATLQEIAEGVAFGLRKNPNLQVFKARDKVYVAVQWNHEIEARDFSFDEFALIENMTIIRTMDEVSCFMAQSNLNAQQMQSHLVDWIKSGIVLCEKIS